MAKEWAKKFYKSKAWQQCRRSYISKRINRDGGMCEVCKEAPGYIVHHKINLTPVNIKDPDVALNHCNLKYECKQCHDKEDGHYMDACNKTKSYCIFDADGNPIGIDER